MPAIVFYTQENIKEIWIRKDDLLRDSFASKTVWIEGKRVNLEPFTALGNEPPSDENLLSLIKTVRSKPKHVLPNDKQEECKKVCIVHWLGKWGQKERYVCLARFLATTRLALLVLLSVLISIPLTMKFLYYDPALHW